MNNFKSVLIGIFIGLFLGSFGLIKIFFNIDPVLSNYTSMPVFSVAPFGTLCLILGLMIFIMCTLVAVAKINENYEINKN